MPIKRRSPSRWITVSVSSLLYPSHALLGVTEREPFGTDLDRAMLFPLRAAVVIGGLSYLALLKDRPDDAPALPASPMQVLPAQTLTAAWDAMSPEVRDRIAREGMDVFARHLAPQPAASADTLDEADRRPAWRGVGAR
jgi:hypothetical protein